MEEILEIVKGGTQIIRLLINNKTEAELIYQENEKSIIVESFEINETFKNVGYEKRMFKYLLNRKSESSIQTKFVKWWKN